MYKGQPTAICFSMKHTFAWCTRVPLPGRLFGGHELGWASASPRRISSFRDLVNLVHLPRHGRRAPSKNHSPALRRAGRLYSSGCLIRCRCGWPMLRGAASGGGVVASWACSCSSCCCCRQKKAEPVRGDPKGLPCRSRQETPPADKILNHSKTIISMQFCRQLNCAAKRYL